MCIVELTSEDIPQSFSFDFFITAIPDSALFCEERNGPPDSARRYAELNCYYGDCRNCHNLLIDSQRCNCPEKATGSKMPVQNLR